MQKAINNTTPRKSPRFRNRAVGISNTLFTAVLSRSTVNCALTPRGNVKVVVRVRPPNEKEQAENSRNVISTLDDQTLIFDPKQNEQAFFYHGVQQRGRDLLKKANKHLQFVFDKVFDADATNNDIFLNTTQGLIESLMDGYNCSVFAYGATGSGKTFTMVGNSENRGITYLTMAELFKVKEELSSERDFQLGITFLEVYNELVLDLLSRGGAPLQLREDGKYGVTVAGIKVEKINNPEDLFRLLEEGNKNRTQHPTDANSESSRSHAVFQVYIQMEFKSTKEIRTAKLSMIDLAGSERGQATGFVGARFVEGANINKSLLALGNCINSLADGKKHVPYRDSKLTRLLKDSLGGNCQTVMIAAVSPSSLSYEDTYNTLKYAARAKKIKSEMKRNVVEKELSAAQYNKINEELRRRNEFLENEVKKLKQQLSNNIIVDQHVDPDLLDQLKETYDEMKMILDRIYNIEKCEQTAILRRVLTEEANSRLSSLCSEQQQKDDGHRRLGNTVTRFKRQELTYKQEIDHLKKLIEDLQNRALILVTNNPQLKYMAEQHDAKFAEFEANHKVDLLTKKDAIKDDELRSLRDSLENVCRMLQNCYSICYGHGFASDAMVKEYQELTRHLLQGRKNVTWTDTTEDSGVSSTTTSASTTDLENRQIKRKIDDITNIKNNGAGANLNSTFVMETVQPTKMKVCAQQLMAKVYKTPPRKIIGVRQQKDKPFGYGQNSKGRNNQVEGPKKPPFRT